MPRTPILSKETIVEKGLEIARVGGLDALTARALSAKLNCSLSPIFTIYNNMDEIKADVRKAALKTFSDYVKDSLNYVPAFKEYGLRLVRFAKIEPALFKIVFLYPDANKDDVDSTAQTCIDAMVKDYGLTKEQGLQLFQGVWTFGCGLALLVSSGAEHYTDEQISEKLSFQFVSTLTFIKSGKQIAAPTPKEREENDKITLSMNL